MERRNSWGSSVRSGSVSPMYTNHQNQMIDDVESERVSEAGDIGDRALHSRKSSESSNLGLSIEHISENGLVLSFPVEQRLQPYQKPLAYYFRSPSSFGNGIVGSEDGEFYFTPCAPVKEEPDKELPVILDYVSCLIHLAVFGILGVTCRPLSLTFRFIYVGNSINPLIAIMHMVLTRYLFQKLFGPGVAGVTSDNTILYLDLPSNMVGSFLMGWFGVVFKGDISNVSEHVAIGITTGYLGSLTTFSGWNQKMLDLSVHGHWLFSALGFLIGLFLVANSIIFGVETAKGFRWLLSKLKLNYSSATNWKVDSYKRQLAVMAAFLVVLGFLWGVSGVLLKHEFKDGGVAAELWFGCLVAPLGVWIRWFLARLNGHGLGRRGLFKWIPFGTLIANLSAACIMAALATMKYSVNNRNCDTIAKGIQFGLLGCLSTVSTFVAEFNAMRESMQPWRAYAYAMITICFSFCFGIVIYCIPIWTVEHHKW